MTLIRLPETTIPNSEILYMHLRIESRFWSFNKGMNGITDAQCLYGGKNVRVGHSIHTFIKRPKYQLSILIINFRI